MTVHSGQHERRNPELASRPRVDLGAVREQQLDDVDVTAGRGQRQRRVVRHVSVFFVGVSTKQTFDNFVTTP